MSELVWDKIEEIFSEAVELSGAERKAFLREKCGDDKALYRKIQALINADEKSDKYLEAPVSLPKTLSKIMAASADSAYTGQTFGAYRAVKKIGSGGMGAVYLAERIDGEFEKQVAIKIIKAGLDWEFNLRNFRRERQILASLDHHNIACLFDGGTTADGLPYLVMEYVEGETLLDYCSSRNLSHTERLKIFLDICSAVEYAHQQKVIHRDIKPSNIVITSGGVAKLLDFGIAKILDANLIHDSSSPTITLLQQLTPEYASPEQIKNEKLTSATDTYSLGIVLYELLTGARPYKFSSRSPYEIAKVICEAEIPKFEVKADNPVSTGFGIEKIIRKALQKKPQNRYGSIKEFSDAIRQYLFSPDYLAESIQEDSANTPIKSIAVAPLKVLTGDYKTADQGFDGNFLGIGLTDALTIRLSTVTELSVRPTSSVLRTAEHCADSYSLGKELEVSYMLDGQVLQLGGQIRVIIQLLDIQHHNLIWASTFDENETDIFRFQDLITEKTVSSIIPQVTVPKIETSKASPSAHAEAYKAYLRGRYYWNIYTTDNILQSEKYFKQAIEFDPNFALAYSGLADFYNWLGVAEISLPKESFAAAKEAALKATEIDENLAEAYASLGFAAWAYDWDFAESEKLYKKSIKLKYNYSKSHEWYAYLLSSTGRHNEALAEMETVKKIDPNSPTVLAMNGFCLYNARRYEEAAEITQQALEIEPNHFLALQGHGWVYPMLGKYEEAIAGTRHAVALNKDLPLGKMALALALLAIGEREEAQELIAELKSIREANHLPAYFLAMMYAATNENEEAFRWLEKAVAERGYWTAWMRVEPRFDALRKDTRFAALESKIVPLENKLKRKTIITSNRESTPQTENNDYRGFWGSVLRPLKSFPASAAFIALSVAAILGVIGFVALRNNQTVNQEIAVITANKTVNTLVILPFPAENNTKDALGIGLADELKSNLGRFKKLSVTSISQAASIITPDDIAGIKRETNADFILHGALQSVGAGRQLDVELLSADSGSVLWKEKFAVEPNSLMSLQGQIAERVLNALAIEFSGNNGKFIAKPYTKDSEAFQFYLAGRYQLASRTRIETEKAYNNFMHAVERDPSFALAYSGLADSQIILADKNKDLKEQYFSKAEEYASKALELDGDLAESHSSMAMVLANKSGQAEAAEKHFLRAIEINPSFATAHHWYSIMLVRQSRINEAIKEINKAVELEPGSAIIQTAAATTYTSANRFAEAIPFTDKAIEIDKDFIPAYMTKSWLLQYVGDYQAALNTYQFVRIYENTPQSELDWLLMKAQTRAAMGDRSQAVKLLEEIFQNETFKKQISLESAEVALIYNLMGEHEEALNWLKKLTPETAGRTNIFEDLRFGELRSDMRFIDILSNLKKS